VLGAGATGLPTAGAELLATGTESVILRAAGAATGAELLATGAAVAGAALLRVVLFTAAILLLKCDFEFGLKQRLRRFSRSIFTQTIYVR